MFLAARIYLDACCLSRLTDDQSQPRVRAEAQAVEHILRMVRVGLALWISSEVLSIEVARNPNQERRRDAQALLPLSSKVAIPGPFEAARARGLQYLGFTPFDALHVACAEQGGAEVLLTTDDALLRRARQTTSLAIRVENPLSWYEERVNATD